MARSTGHAFETQMAKGLRAYDETAWVYKHPTPNMGDKNNQVRIKPPPDITMVAASGAFLIECKAIGSDPKTLRPLPIGYDRVAPHQLEHLIRYDNARSDSFGCIALLSYNKERGSKRRYKAWLIPVNTWMDLRDGSDRKSLPMDVAESHLARYELAYHSGMFDPSLAIDSLLHP